MAKTYIVYYTWSNTASNHAGMAYLVKKLNRAFPKHIKLIEIPRRINKWPLKLQRIHFYFLAIYLKVFLTKSDKVLFMEYLGNVSGNQTGLAIKLREWGVKNKLFGLVHLSGSNLIELYGTTEYIKQGADAVNNILVFGSSLADFFIGLGYKHKITTTFHYVDTNYYKPSKEPKLGMLQVIIVGSIKRNFNKIREIIKECNEINFHICQGNKDLSAYFPPEENVKLYNFLSESELLSLMQTCQVSLNILEDTVGSNVITTSMACGLVNVVSDVGSVRDYCNNRNAMLCKKDEDYINALLELAKNEKLVKELSLDSVSCSQKINLEKSIGFFETILVND
jgi:glycosyltransferase involved in cell wall biosynthesis